MNYREAKAKIRLSEWIGKTVALSGGSGGWKRGLCPFHDDHKPSLLVNDSTGQWRCYPCGIGGDIYDWLQRLHRIDLQEAAKMVYDTLGYAFRRDKAETDRRQARRETLEVLEAAQTYFVDSLTEEQRSWLTRRYNLSPETVAHYRLGFGHSAFPQAMRAAGFTEEQLVAAGLVSQGRFVLSGRITIPYYYCRELCYFSGRAIDPQAKPKYRHLAVQSSKNPQVSPHIRRVLFNIDRVPGCRRVYLVEGAFDAMALQERCWSLGGGAAVACSGSSFSDGDVQLLQAWAPGAQFVVVPDGDEAGFNAGMETVSRLVEVGLAPLVWLLPGGSDPASLGDGLLELQPPISPAEAWARALAPLRGQAQETLFIEKVAPLLNRYPVTQRDAAIETIASVLGMRIGTLREALAKAQRSFPSRVSASPVGAVILEQAVPIAYEQDRQNTFIVFWSRKRETMFHVPLRGGGEVWNYFAPHCGDLDSVLAARWPESDPKERHRVLMQMLRIMVADLRDMRDFHIMRSGLHVGEDDSLVLVGQDVVVVREPGGRWRTHDDCVHRDKLILRDLREDRPWLEWSAAELNQPLRYTPSEVYEHVFNCLSECWSWVEPEDARLWALNCFALPWVALWDVMPWFHVTAPAASGKSCLVEGFLAGRGQFAVMGGPFLVGAAAEENPSEAGTTAKYHRCMRTLILDECEPDDEHVERLLRTMRTSRTGGGKLRGTPHGGYYELFLNNALILSSVDPVVRDTNASRITVTRLLHEEHWASPVTTVPAYWSRHGLDTREARRTMLLAWQDNWQEVRQLYRELAAVVLPGQEVSTPRGKENLLPAITVSHFLGENWRSVSEDLFHAHAVDRRDVDQGARETVLEDTLLNGAFRYEGGDRAHVMTVLQLRGVDQHQTAPYGFAWERGGVPRLYVHGMNAVQSGPLRNMLPLNARQINAALRNCPHYVRTSMPLYKGGLLARWLVFEFSDLDLAQRLPDV